MMIIISIGGGKAEGDSIIFIMRSGIVALSYAKLAKSGKSPGSCKVFPVGEKLIAP